MSRPFYYRRVHHGDNRREYLLTAFGIVLGCVLAIMVFVSLINFFILESH